MKKPPVIGVTVPADTTLIRRICGRAHTLDMPEGAADPSSIAVLIDSTIPANSTVSFTSYISADILLGIMEALMENPTSGKYNVTIGSGTADDPYLPVFYHAGHLYHLYTDIMALKDPKAFTNQAFFYSLVDASHGGGYMMWRQLSPEHAAEFTMENVCFTKLGIAKKPAHLPNSLHNYAHGDPLPA